MPTALPELRETELIGLTEDGRVSVQFMCGALSAVGLERADVEAMLLGVVVRDLKEGAESTAGLQRLMRDVRAAQDASHRQRGRIR